MKVKQDDFWSYVLRRLRKQVGRQIYDTWFKQTTQHSIEANRLVIQVPSPLFKQLFEEKYFNLIQDIVEDVAEKRMELAFFVDENVEDDISALPLFRNTSPTPRKQPRRPVKSRRPVDELEITYSFLQHQYTFDRFVVGSSNQFAHAAAQAVANNPSKAYNPLFIHGGVGLGKTHLMHAIGNWIKSNNPSSKIMYVQSEQFTNDVITHIRFDRMPDFRRKYRSVDVLLIDDIQFIAGKDSTITEFFHTFNTLYNAQKQIVISSDQPPKKISNLEERIRSRFEWGLIADIQPPSLETKVAILQKKAEELGIDLPNNIAIFMASKIKSNIRELEGSLSNLAARVSLTGARIDMDAASEALKQHITDSENVITIDMVQKQVAQFFDIKTSALRAKGRSQDVTVPRQIAMYICRDLTQQSLAEIGKKFGGRNHTTVIHACKKIESDLKKSVEFRNQIELLIGMLQS